MYSYFYRLFQSLILKRSFNEDLIKLIKRHDIQDIIDIGSADSPLLNYINNDYFYHGYELDPYFTNKLKLKYNNNNKLSFYNKGVDDIDFEKFDPKKSIIVLVGLFHHVDDNQVKRFINKTKNFKIFAIDAVKIDGQKNITKLLMAMDRGNFIRKIDNYKKLLINFNFCVAKNRYLRLPYDHLVSTKNIDENIMNELFS
tara:strand:+ start:472 stop:1068 length:597 start_codon:yes stop_codon:yes gene_type:complete